MGTEVKAQFQGWERLTGRGREGAFWRDGGTLHPGFGGGSVGVIPCQTHRRMHLNSVHCTEIIS